VKNGVVFQNNWHDNIHRPILHEIHGRALSHTKSIFALIPGLSVVNHSCSPRQYDAIGHKFFVNPSTHGCISYVRVEMTGAVISVLVFSGDIQFGG